MEIPRLLKVGSHMFSVKYPYQFKERTDLDGRMSLEHSEILLAGKDRSGRVVSQSYLEQVFWHEVFHTIDQIYCCNGIGISNDKEAMIEGLSQGLLQILYDNFEELKVK